jgi:hypothetical protein
MWEILRFDIMNLIIKRYNLKKYLEIGVCDPKECFDRIVCKSKMGVDPGVEFPENPVKYKMTSDDFFTKLDDGKLDLDPNFRWDIIFIDGLHTATQVLKDIENALYHLTPKGFIFLHDCNPYNFFTQREDYYLDGITYSGPWNGSVWKSIYHLRTHRSDLQVNVIDTDWGVGIIRRGKSSLVPFNNHFYEYNLMANNKANDLGLIGTETFKKLYL